MRSETISFLKENHHLNGKQKGTRTDKASNLKRRLYLWHKYMGIAGFIFIIFWTLCNLLQPFISDWLKPGLMYSRIPASPLNQAKVNKSFHEILSQHDIKGFRNFRYVEMNGKYYYQLKNTFNHLLYFDAVTGNQLPDGDQVYAEYLARYFTGDRQSSVNSMYVKEFNDQYTEANLLLPVYKVAFDRPDALAMYIETGQSRLAAYHTWSEQAYSRFLNIFPIQKQSIDPLHTAITWIFLILILTLSLSGMVIYGLRWGDFKVISSRGKVPKWSRFQRTLGMVVSIVLFCSVWSIVSGTMINPTAKGIYYDDANSIFGIADIQVKTTELPWQEVNAYNASVVSMPQGIFYQLFGYDENKQPETYYISASTGTLLPGGDFIYARYLANKFKNFKTKIDAGVSFSCCLPQDTIPDGTQIKKAGIVDTKLITRFDSSYQTYYKRLPVIKVTYEKPENTSFYIETASSSLAALVKSSESPKRYDPSYNSQVTNRKISYEMR